MGAVDHALCPRLDSNWADLALAHRRYALLRPAAKHRRIAPEREVEAVEYSGPLYANASRFLSAVQR